MLKQLILSLLAMALMACEPSEKKPKSPPYPSVESLRAGILNPELERALTSRLNTAESKFVAAKCPDDIQEMLGANTPRPVECGAVQVPEFHDRQSPRRHALAYLRVKSESAAPKPLLIIQQGGPGGSSMMLAALYLKSLPELWAEFDILAVEQRGTAWTRPSAICPETVVENLRDLRRPGSSDIEGALKTCLSEVRKNLDVDSISSYQIAADLDFAAKVFGYERYSFYGVSYGTFTGTYLLRYFASSLEKAVLDSPAVIGKDWRLEAYRSYDHVIKKNIESFIQNSQKKIPWWRGYEATLTYFKESAEGFRRRPLPISITYQNRTYSTIFDIDSFVTSLAKNVIFTYDVENLSYFLFALENRRREPVVSQRILQEFRQMHFDPEADLTGIMYEAIVCRELELDEIRPQAMATNLVEFRKMIPNDVYQEALKEIAVSPCGLGFTRNGDERILREPIATDRPVLVVGGEVDNITPPHFVDEVSRKFTRVHRTVFKGAGHGVLPGTECLNKTILDYLRKPHEQYVNHCE